MKWDLTKLFQTPQMWEKSYEELVEMIDELPQFEGTLHTFESFKEYYDLQRNLSVLLLKVYQYAALTFDLNRKNVENGARVQKVGYQLNRLGQATAWDAPEILKIGKNK